MLIFCNKLFYPIENSVYINSKQKKLICYYYNTAQAYIEEHIGDKQVYEATKYSTNERYFSLLVNLGFVLKKDLMDFEYSDSWEGVYDTKILVAKNLFEKK